MRFYGLTGYPLGHSWSEEYFRNKFLQENITDCFYKNFPLKDINDLRLLIQKYPELQGLNITIPHKIPVIKILDEIDPVAAEIGAINCIRITRENELIKLYGYNTDYMAFMDSLKPELNSYSIKALVLGAGGASRAVCHALRQLTIDYQIVSRHPGRNHLSYNDLDARILSDHTLIINTTPLGMWPDINSFPLIPYHLLKPDHFLYDLVYNPEETMFLIEGKEKGCKIKNGLEMLRIQAELSWQIWTR